MIVTNKSIYILRNYYDESGNKIKTEHSDGRIQQWFYDDENRIVKYVFDNRNNVFEHREEYYKYRSVKHAVVVTMERSNGYSKTTWYDTLNNLRPVYSVSKYGNKTYYNYDDAGNLVSRHTSNGYKERYIYDERGLLVETIHESGRSTKYNYNADDKLIETIYPDGRFETLNSYGFRATTNGGEVSSIKTQLKSGWDIGSYSAVNWVYDTYGEQCLANDISEEIQTAWDNYVKNTVEMYEQKGVYFPTTWFCRQGKFCTGLKNALQKYGYKMARGSYYDNVNITNTAFGNDFCFNTSAFSLYPDSYVKAKEMIDYAVANKVGIVLFSHGIYETEEEAISNFGTTQAILTEICEYIKEYVDNGELEVITYRELYSRYFSQESKELDYRRTIATSMHDWSVTE